MKQIPCIKNKCILYPVCKSKQVINCVDLESYFISSLQTIGYDYNVVWNKITKSIPQLYTIRGKGNGFCDTQNSDKYYKSMRAKAL